MTTRINAREAHPPRWAEALLRFFLSPRDRESVSGDLLEEYREVILPSRGRWRAQLWYFRHALSLIDGVTAGLALGAIFGLWNVVATALDPLAEDAPALLLMFYGPMFAAWGIAGFLAARGSGRFVDAVKKGATVAFVSFTVFWLLNLFRVNLFLDVVRARGDWQNLLVRYRASGFAHFRVYVNYEYLTGAPLEILLPSMIGAVVGSIGGLLAIASRHLPTPGTRER
jgi:hypothetical protein